jgi:hypothetical protein
MKYNTPHSHSSYMEHVLFFRNPLAALPISFQYGDKYDIWCQNWGHTHFSSSTRKGVGSEEKYVNHSLTRRVVRSSV